MQQTFEVNIVLVGVSGVGKTTLGRLASKNLGIGFVDLDDSFEREERSDIDSLMTKYGDNGYAKRILAHYAKLVNENKGIMFLEKDNNVIMINSNRLAFEELQREMAGEAEKAGVDSEQDVVNLVKEMRRKIWEERKPAPFF